jgi:hypothetical protein
MLDPRSILPPVWVSVVDGFQRADGATVSFLLLRAEEVGKSRFVI